MPALQVYSGPALGHYCGCRFRSDLIIGGWNAGLTVLFIYLFIRLLYLVPIIWSSIFFRPDNVNQIIDEISHTIRVTALFNMVV